MSQNNSPILTILVPVYNEENTLREILDRVTAIPVDNYEVIVVNDASKDKSPKIIEDFQKSFKSKTVALRVVHHKKNLGKGAGIQTAVKVAKGKYFVIQDADLEYLPEDLPKLLKYAIKNNHPVVYGSRFKGKIENMPKPNYYANRFYNFLLRRLYDTSITDMHTCYKMLKTDLFRQMDIQSAGFGYATELVSKILRNDITIEEVPIRFSGRTKKDGKKIDVMDGVECTVKLVQFRFTPRHDLDGYDFES